MKKIVTTIFVLAMALVIPTSAFADDAGWQKKGVDGWYVDDSTTTTPRSFEGGGVRACFSGLAYTYDVQLMENDDANPDDTIGSAKTASDGKCVEWSGVDTESGNEELYLKITKDSTKTDYIEITWYD
ncbi:hypothetical protein [Peribacillus frigoritolerans]|uniref:hypothetical protein n=1 Tax=Peribacillus frigoritolerans TaxID=450367 RepID=UPI002E237FBB|nr:hypothetical protein [Peribacillus frigoritolerans]